MKPSPTDILHRHTRAVLHHSDSNLCAREALEGAVRAGANLGGASLVGADLEGANFRHANLRDATRAAIQECADERGLTYDEFLDWFFEQRA